MDINQMTILGNLGDDPKMTIFDNGDKVVKLAVATGSYWRDKKSGQQKEDTEWHTVYIRGRMAEVAQEYLKKGHKVYIRGKMRTRKYTNDKQETHWVTEIHSNKMMMISGNSATKNPVQKVPNKQVETNYVEDVGSSSKQYETVQTVDATDVTPSPKTVTEEETTVEAPGRSSKQYETVGAIDVTPSLETITEEETTVEAPVVTNPTEGGSEQDNEVESPITDEDEAVEDDFDIELDSSDDLTDEFNRKVQAASEQDEISGVSDLPDWLIP